MSGQTAKKIVEAMSDQEFMVIDLSMIKDVTVFVSVGYAVESGEISIISTARTGARIVTIIPGCVVDSFHRLLGELIAAKRKAEAH